MHRSRQFKSFIDFLKFLECPYINYLQCGKDGHIDYTSSTSTNEFLRVLSDVIDSSITQKVHEPPVVTVLTDESTDIVVPQKLAINVRVVDPVTLTPSTFFFRQTLSFMLPLAGGYLTVLKLSWKKETFQSQRCLV